MGFAVSFSGPYAQGAESTTWSQYRLWAQDVNAAGGIYLKKYDKKLPVELVEYDDRSQLDEATRLVERLILEDKVDFVLPPWGRATNLAVAPLFNKYEYPAILFTISSMAPMRWRQNGHGHSLGWSNPMMPPGRSPKWWQNSSGAVKLPAGLPS
jgi:branched-chain amino acid transport system substrate-binding protein